MQVGDIVKHSGDDGWWMMKGKIGVLIELLDISDPREGQWLVHWTDADTPKYYREIAYFPEHLEVLNENR
jgi:hypothetical protein